MLKSILNVLQVVAILLWTAGWITLSILVSLFTFDRETPLVMARRNWAPGVLALAGVRLEVAPLPDLDWSKPYIFVMNHQSMLDIPAAFASLPTQLRFLAKHSLAYVPFLGWYMTFTRMVFVDRRNRTKAMESLRDAGARIRQGASLLTYPEGTQSRTGALQSFKRGAFVVALEAQVPIVPVAISGTAAALRSGSLRLRGGTVHLKVGAPIPTQGRDPEDRDRLASEIQEAVAQLLRSLPQEPGASAPIGSPASVG